MLHLGVVRVAGENYRNHIITLQKQRLRINRLYGGKPTMNKIPFETTDLLSNPAVRRASEEQKRQEIQQRIQTLINTVKSIPDENLDSWDRESLHRVTELSSDERLDDLRRQIARIMALAGENYEINKSTFWRQHRAKQKLNPDE